MTVPPALHVAAEPTNATTCTPRAPTGSPTGTLAFTVPVAPAVLMISNGTLMTPPTLASLASLGCKLMLKSPLAFALPAQSMSARSRACPASITSVHPSPNVVVVVTTLAVLDVLVIVAVADVSYSLMGGRLPDTPPVPASPGSPLSPLSPFGPRVPATASSSHRATECRSSGIVLVALLYSDIDMDVPSWLGSRCTVSAA